MEIIDPHLHLFDLEEGDYHWLNQDSLPDWPDKHKIRKNYSEPDLGLPGQLSLNGFVHIEAGFDNTQPWREIEWLEKHCQLPFRSVAFADLTSESFSHQLDKLFGYKSLVGIRFILDDRATELLSNPVFQQSLKHLEQQKLIFEAQLSLLDLPAIKLLSDQMEKVPELNVVINHAGFPAALSQEWMEAVTALAHHPQCFIKCSGWEMLDRQWTVETVKPYVKFVISQFGLSRVMIASNFPVSELSCSYADLWRRYFKEMKFNDSEKKLLMHDTAEKLYGFKI
jgi:predicted TIM-barrel fold metal-dependent hydrolase